MFQIDFKTDKENCPKLERVKIFKTGLKNHHIPPDSIDALKSTTNDLVSNES